jgi:hypothetical protein
MKKYIITYLSKGKIKHLNIKAACIASSYVIAAISGIGWEYILNSKLN